MSLRAAGWFVAVSHGVAAGLAGVVLRPGAPGEASLAERMTYVADSRGAWLAGWLAFSVAAIGMVWWAVGLRKRLQSSGLGLAVAAIAAGAALEIVSHCLNGVMLPPLASAGETSSYLSMERTAQIIGLVVGQLGFGLGTLLIVMALARTEIHRGIVVAGGVNVAAAVVMMGAGIHGDAAPVAAAATMVVIATLLVLAIGTAQSKKL